MLAALVSAAQPAPAAAGGLVDAALAASPAAAEELLEAVPPAEEDEAVAAAAAALAAEAAPCRARSSALAWRCRMAASPSSHTSAAALATGVWPFPRPASPASWLPVAHEQLL